MSCLIGGMCNDRAADKDVHEILSKVLDSKLCNLINL